MSELVPAEWIEWDADCHLELTVDDFEWVLDPSFPILEIGGQRFIDEMADYLDSEIENTHKDEDSRVLTWVLLDKELEVGGSIEEPVQIALVDYTGDLYPRKSVCGGWHRIGAAVKHGRTTLPAYVGRRKV